MSIVSQYIRKSFSLKLSLSMMAMVAAIFMITIGFLFFRSRMSVRQVAIEQTSQMLENTAHHLEGVLIDVEVATNNTDWIVLKNLRPDTIFSLSRQILEQNPSLNGCSISFEPYFFEKEGKFFSAYSSNENGHIETEQEGNDDYVYFDMDWFKIPYKEQKACWIDPFQDYNPNGIYARNMIASYCKPLVTEKGRCIGVISSDITQRRLSQMLVRDQLYKHSYYMLLGKHGQIIATGNEEASVDDLDSSGHLVLKREIANTGWTLAIICLESDIFTAYYRLAYIIVSIIIFGLLLMLVVCYMAVRRITRPVRELATSASSIAGGNYDVPIDETSRYDEIGQLQNSFVSMQQSIASYVNSLQKVKAETERRNVELQAAKEQAVEADRNKAEFIQDISHQIRTPLNIISGFVQALHGGREQISEDEMVVITHELDQNSHTIANIIDNWMQTLTLEGVHTVERHDDVNCNELCRQVAGEVSLRNPAQVTLQVESNIPDDMHFFTDKNCLLKILGELLHNANKYTLQGFITIGCEQLLPGTVSFVVSDTGPGIPDADRERIFTQFTKLSNFNEGLGMGLTLCRQLAVLLGGSLTLDIHYSGGSRFVLTLPL